eukprot:m.28909 g.28909  ORF g.28909 m.28909 type:complete len:111 (+) comp31094_c0_seq6:162-494(+)
MFSKQCFSLQYTSMLICKLGFIMSFTGQIVNEYTPPERGYRASLLSKKGWLQRWEAFKMKLVTTYSIGIIKRYAKPFKVIAFAKEAEKLFSEVNTALARGSQTFKRNCKL